MHRTPGPVSAAVDYNHLALPVGYAQEVEPEATAPPRSGHWVRRLPVAGFRPDRPEWIPVPARQVNATGSTRPRFESMIPLPPQARLLNLTADTFLTSALQDADKSLAWYAQEVARREQMEKRNEEYALPALRPALDNMRTFIAHLLADRQFVAPLRAPERRALQKMDGAAQTLLDLQMPYKRTVVLSCAFATLYDLLVQQRVLEPLAQQHPELTQRRDRFPSLWLFEFFTRAPDRKVQKRPVTTIEPEQVASCVWHGLNPGGLDEKNCLFAQDLDMNIFLPQLLDEPSLFLYPSWAQLDLEDFCSFGHLPIYPLGLITTYAANADGAMHSPLLFITHDLFHIFQMGSFQCLDGLQPLEKPVNRYAFRQLMLDRLPQALAPWQLKKAMTLLVFHLLHEEDPNQAMRKLEAKSFMRLMWIQAQARRQRWCDYSSTYQDITDEQGTLAALWMHRLFTHWRAAGCTLTPAQLNGFARHFMETDLTLMQWHLAYIEQHRTALREGFLSRAEETPLSRTSCATQNRRFLCTGAVFLHRKLDHFFHWQEPHGGCCVDHSDVVYFDSLHQDGGPEHMERATGHPILHRTAF